MRVDCATPEQGGTRHRLGWHDPGEGGGGDSTATTLVVGAYPVRGEMSRQLMDALPVVLRVDAGDTGDPVLDHLPTEVARDEPASRSCSTGSSTGCWSARCAPGWTGRAATPAWWTAQKDPVVGQALSLLHTERSAVDGGRTGPAHRRPARRWRSGSPVCSASRR
ncbi:cupin domain-containing protein [Streptomyces sp. MNU103]|nr:cupin domain-containing protein [Streptomyces sp. MNU103]